jgi:hypothetical protein
MLIKGLLDLFAQYERADPRPHDRRPAGQGGERRTHRLGPLRLPIEGRRPQPDAGPPGTEGCDAREEATGARADPARHRR